MAVSQRLLAELFHEDNVDGVLYHQDAVVLKGSASDDSRNFTGSLLLIQKRPVGAKRFLKGVALPQPNYLVWLPYSYLYCLASHLLSSNARKAIDGEQDLSQLTAFTAKLKMAMIELETPSLLGGGGGGLNEPGSPKLGGSFAGAPTSSPSSPSPSSSSGVVGPTIVDDHPQRLDWQYTICLPIGHIHKMIRKSNIRGRRVLTLVRKETLAVEAPLVFEEGGMSKLFDELKRVCQVDIRAGDEAYLSKEIITSSTPYYGMGEEEDGEYHHSNNNNQRSTDELAESENRKGGGGVLSRASRAFGGGGGNNLKSEAASESGGVSSATPSESGRDRTNSRNSDAGSNNNNLADYDREAFHRELYGSSSIAGGGGLLSGGFKSKATAAAEREKQGNSEGKSSGGGGFMSTVLSIGATFARGTAKAANSLLPDINEDNTTDSNSAIASRVEVGRSPSSAAKGDSGRNHSRFNTTTSSQRTDTESEFDFAEDVNELLAKEKEKEEAAAAAAEEANQHFIHADGQLRRHQEPMAPVLRMPLNNRKFNPPLGRNDWKVAFENNVNSVRLTSTKQQQQPQASTAAAAAAPLTPTTAAGSPTGGGTFPSVLPTDVGNSNSHAAASPSTVTPPPPAAAAVMAAANPNLIARELAYGGTGTLRDEETFRKLRVKAYNGTISDDIRPQVWAYLLGVFPVGSTPQERKVIMDAHEVEYTTLLMQWRSIFPAQEARFGAFREHKIAIEKDVMRTDRTHPDFKDDESVKLKQLRNVLMCYAMYNFDLGYCQGMSDVLAILLLVYPDDEVMCYTVFKHLLTNKMEGNFRTDMKRNIEVHLKEVQLLISKFSPELYAHLVSVGAEGMTFTFRWLLILFKREFEIKQCIRLWDVIFASPYTPHFEALVVAALLHNVGYQIIEQQLAYDEILKFANLMSNQLDVNDVIMLSHDFYNMVTNTLQMQMVRAGAVGSGSGATSVGGVGDGNSGAAASPLTTTAAAASSTTSAAVANSGVVSPSSAALESNSSQNFLRGRSTSMGLGGSVPTEGTAAGGGSNSNSSAAAVVVRPTLPEIIKFLEKESQRKGPPPLTEKTFQHHRDPSYPFNPTR